MPFATWSSVEIMADETAAFAVCGRNVDAESAEDVVSETSSVLNVSELRARGALSGSLFSGSLFSERGVVLIDDPEATGVSSLSSPAGDS
jgi:hypothetical protein